MLLKRLWWGILPSRFRLQWPFFDIINSVSRLTQCRMCSVWQRNKLLCLYYTFFFKDSKGLHFIGLSIQICLNLGPVYIMDERSIVIMPLSRVSELRIAILGRDIAFTAWPQAWPYYFFWRTPNIFTCPFFNWSVLGHLDFWSSRPWLSASLMS